MAVDGFQFPSDGSADWLSLANARVVVSLLGILEETDRVMGSPSTVLEIGVWKGAWSQVVLRNTASQVFAIDPYPSEESKEIREGMLRRMGAMGFNERFVLNDSWETIPSKIEFDLIHIDGLHTESAVADDLSRSAQQLRPNGVIVVDDYFHGWFPGIASAMFRFLDRQDYRIFMTCESKANLARRNVAKEWWEACRETLPNIPGLRVSRFLGDTEAAKPAYIQETTVLGQEVLICEAKGPQELKGTRRGMKGVAAEWLPPAVYRSLRLVKRNV